MMEAVSGMRCPLYGARFAVSVAALVGALALHGFSLDHMWAPVGMIASPSQVEACAAETDVAHSGVGVCASHCSTNHTRCVATLRDSVQLKSPANGELAVVAHQLGLGPAAVAMARSQGGRAPPDPSLAMLCTYRI
jgi:hypothetical protein